MKSNLHGIGLRYFVDVARAGSLKGASEALHVDVSAISRQISKLEKELGCALFDRLAHGMVLNEAGQKLLAYATRSLLDAEHIAHQLQDLAHLRTGTVRVACTQGFAYDLVPDLIAGFCRDYPGVNVRLFVGSPKKVSQRVREGDSDIGLTFNISPEAGVFTQHTENAPVHALLRADDPLAKASSLCLQDLNGRQVVLPEAGTTLRDLVDICVGQSGVELRPLLESNNHYALYKVAQATGAVLFTARLSVQDRFEQDGFVAVALRDEVLHKRSFQMQTMAGRSLPNIVTAFCDYVKSTLQKNQATPASTLATNSITHSSI